VIVDGSADTFYQKVLEIKDFRLKILDQENQDVLVVRNKGIEHEKYRYTWTSNQFRQV
jgi:hypothetical protein